MTLILEIFESFENDVHDFAKGVLNFDCRNQEDEVIGKEIEFRRSRMSPQFWPKEDAIPEADANVIYERGVPVRKSRRKKKAQVTMIDTTRLQHVDTFTRLALKPMSSSISCVSTSSESSSWAYCIKRGLK